MDRLISPPIVSRNYDIGVRKLGGGLLGLFFLIYFWTHKCHQNCMVERRPKSVRSKRQKSSPWTRQSEADDFDQLSHKPFSIILPSMRKSYNDVELQCTTMDLILQCLNPAACEKLAGQGDIAEVVHALLGVQSEDLQLMLLTLLRLVSSVESACQSLLCASPAIMDFLLQKLAVNKSVEFGKRWISCDARAQSYLIPAAFAAHTHPLLIRLKQFQYVSHEEQNQYMQHSEVLFQLCWAQDGLPSQACFKQARSDFTWSQLAAGSLVNLGYALDADWWAHIFLKNAKLIHEFRKAYPASLLPLYLVELIIARAPQVIDAQPTLLGPSLYAPACWSNVKSFFDNSQSGKVQSLAIVLASAQFLWILCGLMGTSTEPLITEYIASLLSDIREDNVINDMVNFALDTDSGRRFSQLACVTWQFLTSLAYNFGNHFTDMVEIVLSEPCIRDPNPVVGNCSLHLAVLIALIKPLLSKKIVRRVQKCVRGFYKHAPLPLKPSLKNAYIGLIPCLSPMDYYDPQDLVAWQERTFRKAKERNRVELHIAELLKNKATGSNAELDEYMPTLRAQDPVDEPFEFDVGPEGDPEEEDSDSSEFDNVNNYYADDDDSQGDAVDLKAFVVPFSEP